MEFDRLERAIERINAHLTDYLAPGLPAAEIAALMEGRPYQLPADVVQLYQWHNGESSEAPLPWNLTGTANHFLPLQQALLDEKGYELRREMLALNFGEGRIPAELDAPAYIVLFEDGGGDEMFVPCWNQPAATSPIYYYDEDDEVSIAYGGVAESSPHSRSPRRTHSAASALCWSGLRRDRRSSRRCWNTGSQTRPRGGRGTT